MMLVKEYTKEFYKINNKAGHQERHNEKVARYMNGLRYDIVGSQLNFFFDRSQKSCLHPLSDYDKALSHCATRHLFHLRQLHFDFDSIFTTESVKIPFLSFGL
jgi:hypothetical protein